MMREKDLVNFRKLVRSILPGPFFSKETDPAGVEFQGFREIEPGDSHDLIDWNASLFTYPRKLLVRLGEKRRNLILWVILDISRSMRHHHKAALGILHALRSELEGSEHQVGVIKIGEMAEFVERPSVGSPALLRALGSFFEDSFTSQNTNLGLVFDLLLKRYGSFSQVAVIISDFIFKCDYGDLLKRFLYRGNESIFLALESGEERKAVLPLWACVEAEDSESGSLEYIGRTRNAEDTLMPHFALWRKCRTGWAPLNSSGVRATVLEEKLRSVFRYEGGEK